ncbi:MAG: ABC transporter substrate-binding protein [Gammaproteobacteria bacterium]
MSKKSSQHADCLGRTSAGRCRAPLNAGLVDAGFVASVVVTCAALIACWHANASEPPSLEPLIRAGELPALAERIPSEPWVMEIADDGAQPGRYGGTLRLLMGRAKDVRQMVVYGYARLVGYDRNYSLQPDILRDFDVQEDRIFTFHLRAGHRWSDGHPFTSEDFRYYWEDVAGNEAIMPFGPPRALLVDGERPHFEVIDERTVRYTFEHPNPYFLPQLAGASPSFIYAPAHYLKQFHARYTDPAGIEAIANKEQRKSWASVHINRFRPYKTNNPELPTLQPWVVKTAPPTERFVFERNAYFHCVDSNGLQLPYIGRVEMNIVDGRLIPAKSGAGESDLQARGLSFSDYTFLKRGPRSANYHVHLWETTKGSHIALYPNLNAEDPEWRKLVRDVRLRHALSLAINREEINQVIYYGLASPGNDTVFPRSPLFEERFRAAWAEFDLERANALLDEIGLTQRNGAGIRLLPDGRPMELIVETAGEDTEQTDVLELIRETWRLIGVKLFSKPLQREVFRNRIFAGKSVMSVWFGLENGLPTPDTPPIELAPTSQQQLQWPKWGQYLETGGASGEPADYPAALELQALGNEWVRAPNRAERMRIWRRMLEIRAEQVFTLGIVANVPQPVVVNKSLRNVPVKGIYNFDPGAHFGIYRPATFWFDE